MATNNFINRGVEAKLTKITNVHLEMDASETSRQATESSATPAFSDQTASYVQVIVQKQRRARLPAASSPVRDGQGPQPVCGTKNGLPGDAAPAAVLLAYPTLAAFQSAYGDIAHGQETTGGNYSIPPDRNKVTKSSDEEIDKKSTRKPLGTPDYDSSDDESEVVEVLRLERAGAALAARGGRRGGRAERAARRVRRRAGRLLRAALAFPRLLLELPIDLLLHIERCLLEAVRSAAVGGAGAAAEALGKPALAAAHNALVAALAAAAGAARGAREALRPLAAALGDALDPLARLAASLRLVHVERVHHLHCARCPRADAGPAPRAELV